jgi:transposase
MRQEFGKQRATVDQAVKDIRRNTRKHHSAEEKIRIVLEGLRGEESIAELCRGEGIATSLYYSWSKEFLEAGKRRLAGDTARQASSPEVKELRAESTIVTSNLPFDEWTSVFGSERLTGAARPADASRPYP